MDRKTVTESSAQRTRLLAKLHIAKGQLGLDDDAYRDMLEIYTGRRSAKELSEEQIAKVLRMLTLKGWKPVVPTRPRVLEERRVQDPCYRLLTKVEAMLAEAKRKWAYADAIALRMYKVQKIEWCRPDQLQAIVGEMMQDAKRHGRATA